MWTVKPRTPRVRPSLHSLGASVTAAETATGVVLDASAVLAMLFEEPGGEQVAEAFADAAISAVNLAEVLGRLARDGVPEDRLATIEARLRRRLRVVDFGAGLAGAAARLAIGRAGLSLGDRACIATAQWLGLPALTAERMRAPLGPGVEVRLIR